MLKDKYKYKDEEECYADRHHHRKEWYDAICDYNERDAATLGREIFKEHDIYCGLRNKREFFAMKNTNVFDYAIWVDRSDHLPPEAKAYISKMVGSMIECAYPEGYEHTKLPKIRFIGVGPNPGQIISDIPKTLDLINN